SDDDVRAVAASILIPIADYFVQLAPNKIPEIVTVLWDCLKDLKDDLTASTASADASDQRLYPFFRHTITSVRVAVLNTLLTFLGMDEVEEWVDHRTFSLVFQNIIVEEKRDVLYISLKVWSRLLSHVSKPVEKNKLFNFTSQHIGSWFSIVMTPLGTPIERRLFYIPDGPIPMETTPITVTSPSNNSRRRNSNRNNNGGDIAVTSGGYSIDTGMLQQDFALVSVDTILRGRVIASKGLGMLMSCWPSESLESTFKEYIINCLSSSWALSKQLAAVITEEWSRSVMEKEPQNNQSSLIQNLPLASILSNAMISILESNPPRECQAMLNTFVSVGKVNSDIIPPLPTYVLGEKIQTDNSTSLFGIEIAAEFSTDVFNNLLSHVSVKNRRSSNDDTQSQLQDRQRRVVSSIGYYEASKQKNDTIVFAAIAGAVVALRVLPSKLNPVIRSIMNSIKSEENFELQKRSASTLASLVELCSYEDNTIR
ncbi:1104_t:CDS:2, partial [Dentiscutata erythropus]